MLVIRPQMCTPQPWRPGAVAYESICSGCFRQSLQRRLSPRQWNQLMHVQSRVSYGVMVEQQTSTGVQLVVTRFAVTFDDITGHASISISDCIHNHHEFHKLRDHLYICREGRFQRRSLERKGSRTDVTSGSLPHGLGTAEFQAHIGPRREYVARVKSGKFLFGRLVSHRRIRQNCKLQVVFFVERPM